MPYYRDRDARGAPDELVIIEDAAVVLLDDRGRSLPSYRYVGHHTIRAHPLIIEALLAHAERVWHLEDLLAELEPSRPANQTPFA